MLVGGSVILYDGSVILSRVLKNVVGFLRGVPVVFKAVSSVSLITQMVSVFLMSNLGILAGVLKVLGTISSTIFKQLQEFLKGLRGGFRSPSERFQLSLKEVGRSQGKTVKLSFSVRV